MICACNVSIKREIPTLFDLKGHLANFMSWLKAYAVAITSLLAGAAVVHNVYKPDLVSSSHRHLNSQVLNLQSSFHVPASTRV